MAWKGCRLKQGRSSSSSVRGGLRFPAAAAAAAIARALAGAVSSPPWPSSNFPGGFVAVPSPPSLRLSFSAPRSGA
ncbi:hypothetical protein NL676_027555 [Syzygium grande]|nr:hypothetical protein NL676_027555 [Syzygium grande]